MTEDQEVQQEQAQEQAQEPQVEETPPLYVFALTMLADGEVKVITDLPFASQRKATGADVLMLTGYVNDVLKRDGQL